MAAPHARDCPHGNRIIYPAVRVGHVHLRVADLDRGIAFYRDALGFSLVADGREAGIEAAFLAAGITTIISASVPGKRERRAAALGRTHRAHHVALVYPDRRELGRAVERLLDTGHPIDHGTDHGANVSVYN